MVDGYGLGGYGTGIPYGSVGVPVILLLPIGAEFVYEKMQEKNWEAIKTFAQNPETVLAGRLTGWVCERTGLKVAKRFCLDCVANRKYRQDAIAHAEIHGKEWRGAPCGYEVSYRKDNLVDGFVAAGDSVEAAFEKAVAQSIENNFWLG